MKIIDVYIMNHSLIKIEFFVWSALYKNTLKSFRQAKFICWLKLIVIVWI